MYSLITAPELKTFILLPSVLCHRFLQPLRLTVKASTIFISPFKHRITFSILLNPIFPRRQRDNILETLQLRRQGGGDRRRRRQGGLSPGHPDQLPRHSTPDRRPPPHRGAHRGDRTLARGGGARHADTEPHLAPPRPDTVPLPTPDAQGRSGLGSAGRDSGVGLNLKIFALMSSQFNSSSLFQCVWTNSSQVKLNSSS